MDDCILCVLRNGFTAHERTIVAGGDPGRVIAMRQDFQRLMERQYRETIETITGRKVVAFLSQAHLEPDITLEIFAWLRLDHGRSRRDSRTSPSVWSGPYQQRPHDSCRCESPLVAAGARAGATAGRCARGIPGRGCQASRARLSPGQLPARGGEGAADREGQTSVDGVRDGDGSLVGAVGRAVRDLGGTPWARGAIWRTRG